MVQEEAEDVAERAVVVCDLDAAPFQIHAEMFHITVDGSIEFSPSFILFPTVVAGGHVAEGDDNEFSTGFEKAIDFFACGFEIINVNDGEVADDEVEVVIGTWDGFGERFDIGGIGIERSSVADEFGDGINGSDGGTFGFEDSGVASFAATEIEDGFVGEFGEEVFEGGVEDDSAGPVAVFTLIFDPSGCGFSPFLEWCFHGFV